MKNKVFSFENLYVWNRSKELVKFIYKLTSDFPVEEKYGLKAQLRRASISVCSNLAEGSSRVSPNDQAYFTNISYSSLMEILNQVIISKDLEYINKKDYLYLRKEIQMIAFMLNKLREAQIK